MLPFNNLFTTEPTYLDIVDKLVDDGGALLPAGDGESGDTLSYRLEGLLVYGQTHGGV